MMADPNPHIRAVPNPPNNTSETKELIKTVALTSAVSALVGVFAVAGGQALFNLIKRAVKGREAPPAPAAAPNYAPPVFDDEMPDALRMEPRLRNSGRRRRPRQENGEEIGRMFSEFETKLDARFDAMDRRMNDLFEEDDAEEEEED